MNYGELKHLEDYKEQIPSFLYACLEEIRKMDFTELKDGHYEVLGCKMSVETSPSEPAEDRKAEAHKKFIDVVYEVDVEEEWIGVQPVYEAGPLMESHEDRDLYFYKAERSRESRLYLTTGRFVIFFPNELHRPLCQGEKGSFPLRKAVVKVPVEKIALSK